MFFKNSIDIEGRITSKPQLKVSQNGTDYCRFSIAYNQSRKDKESGEWSNIPHFFNCVTFKKLAHNVTSFSKGDPVTISGVLQYSSYEKNGEKKNSVSILVNDIKLLNLPKKSENSKSEKDSNNSNSQLNDAYEYDPDNDIPF